MIPSAFYSGCITCVSMALGQVEVTLAVSAFVSICDPKPQNQLLTL